VRAALPAKSSRRSKKECREFEIACVVVIDPRCRGVPLRGDGHTALGKDAICILMV
jgi:hypothetical protein